MAKLRTRKEKAMDVLARSNGVIGATEDVVLKGGLLVPTGKIPELEFVQRCIMRLVQKDKVTGEPMSKGIHAVYSGFNAAFRAYFGKDPVESVKVLVSAGQLVTRPVYGGVMIYNPADAPKARDTVEERAKKALATILA